MTHKPALLASALVVACFSTCSAQAASFAVAGSSDPFLAGQAAGAACCNGDSAPGQSPVYAGAVVGGATYTFTNVTGGADYSGGTPSTGPDGSSSYRVSTPDYENGATVINGIAGFYNAPINALVGVFLSDNDPNTDPASGALDFGDGAIGTAFPTLSPALQQVFFIGDGLAGNDPDSVQTFIAPVGATRLYLGTVDGFGWFNNTGTIDVTVNVASSVPEPGTLALMLSGLAALAWKARRRP